MTVGELRKALEGVADDMPVVRVEESWFVSPDEAHVRKMCEADDEDFGIYADPDGYRSNLYRGKPTYDIFVIE